MTAPRAGGMLRSPARQRLLFASLYFAEGAPIGFVWWALPVWLRSAGVTPSALSGVMALVALPWTLKFAWAPLVDVVRGPRFNLRGWILASQLAMALTLVPLLFVDLADSVQLVTVALLAHGLAAATQDAAIDSLAIHAVDPTRRGQLNGWMQTGLLVGRGAFGGGALLLASALGERATVALLMAAILLPALVVVFGLRDVARVAPPRAGPPRDYLRALGAMLRTRRLWLGLLVACTAGAGFESLASFAGPLLVDFGASEADVGAFFLAPVVALMALGALLGGRLADRFGRRRVSAWAVGLSALTVVAVGVRAWTGAELPSDARGDLFVLLGLLYLVAGAATASLYGLLMDLVDPSLAAAQFCAFMAGINICYAWSTRALGGLVEAWGYGPAIVVMGSASLVALPWLLSLRETSRSAGAARAREADASEPASLRNPHGP